MWIVIDVMGDCPDSAMIALDEGGQNLLFDTDEQAERWALENCAWSYKIVKI